MPAIVAARRLGMSLETFNEALPRLLERGFPPADPTTGNFDLDAIDTWRRTRFPHLFADRLTLSPAARDAKDVVAPRLARIRGG